jgi:hypothetical protein
MSTVDRSVKFHVVGKHANGTLHYTVRGPAHMVRPGNVVRVPAKRGVQRVVVGDIIDEQSYGGGNMWDQPTVIVTAEIAPLWFSRAVLRQEIGWSQLGGAWMMVGPSSMLVAGQVVEVRGKAGVNSQRVGTVIEVGHGVSVAVPGR